MSILKLMFAGEIKKAEHRTAGGKPVVDVSVCKKNRAKDKEEFTWVRVTIWEPADFQTPKLVKGAFISGVCDIELRAFQNKEGAKDRSLEGSCRSFDVEVAAAGVDAHRQQRQAGPIVPKKADAKPSDDTEPPF